MLDFILNYFTIFLLGYNANTYINILYHLSAISILVPICISLIRLRYLNRTDYLFLYLVVFGLIIEIRSRLYTYNFHLPNMWIINIYVFIEIIILVLFYHQLLLLKKYVIVLILLIIYGLDLLIYDFKDFNKLHTVTQILESLFVIISSIIAFLFPLRKLHITNIYNSNLFWYNAALFIYFTGSFFLVSSIDYLIKYDLQFYYYSWGIWHSFLNITMNFMIAIGFWKSINHTKINYTDNY